MCPVQLSKIAVGITLRMICFYDKSYSAPPRLGGRNGQRSPIINLLEGSTAHYKEHSQQIEDNLEGALSLGA